MKNISLHISKLLFDYNKVVVPGLGVFEANVQETYHHPVSNEFAPKFKKIVFVRDTNINDELLAKAIATDNADELIKKYTESLIKELTDTKKFYIENVGWLKQIPSGALIFEQDKGFNYEKSYYGMQAFTMPALAVKEDEKIVIPPVVKTKIKSNNVLNEPINSLEEKNIKQQNNQDKYNNTTPSVNNDKSKIWLWLIITGAVAMIIFAFIIYTDYLIPKEKKEHVKAELTNTTKNVKAEKTILDEIDSSNISKASTKMVDNDSINNKTINIKSKTIDKNINNKQYYVIAGCFRSTVKANEYLSFLKNNGYPNASIEGKTSGGLTRVCYKGFDTRSAADNYLDKVSKKENKELWIQMIKK